MAEKDNADIGFNEALRRIANTPKATVVVKKHHGVEIKAAKVYNENRKAAVKPPHPAKRRP